MGSGTAKKARLDLGIDLRTRIHGCGGTDEDIQLVLEAGDDFLGGVAKQIVERAGIIRCDRDGFRLTDPEVVIQIPGLKRLTLEQVQADWDGVQSIEPDDSTEEPVTLRLATILKSDENYIEGEVYERRLMKLRLDGRLLGLQHRKWLVDNQDDSKAIPDEHIRKAIKALVGKVYVDFSGTIVVNRDGDRCVPCVSRGSSGRFGGSWNWLDDRFDSNGRVAVSGK